MSLRTLPEINALQEPRGYMWDVPSDTLARWAEMPRAAAADEPQTITLYDVIGEDPWSGNGFSARKLAAILRNIGAKDVTVRINSPGGNVFEGFAIYNELVQHKAKVTVDVMGIAASAAAIIAMAGDEIRMGLGSLLMVHNSWGMVIGNRHDLDEAASAMKQIDNAQIDIFEARTGLKRSQIEKYLDGETFFSAKEAVEKKFADSVIERQAEANARADLDRPVYGKRKLDALLAQAGMSRSERYRLIEEATGGMRDAALTVMRDADLEAGLRQLAAQVKAISKVTI